MASRGYEYKAAQGGETIPVRSRDAAAVLAQAGGRLPKQPPAIFADRMTKEEKRHWYWVQRRCDWLSVEDSPVVFEYCNVSRLLFECREYLGQRIAAGGIVSQVRTLENSLSQRHFRLLGELGVTPLARTRLLQFQHRQASSSATAAGVDSDEALRVKYFGG